MSPPAASGTAGGRPPFFIVGADRSGTTLLRLYLNAHSELVVPSESWFLIDLFAEFGPQGVLNGADIDRAVQLVTQHPRFIDGWDVGAANLRADLARVEPLTMATFCDRLYRLQTRAGPRTSWGDKTPEYVEHLRDLDSCFPNAQYIHLVRDGRDVYLSLAKRRWSDRGYTPHELGSYWNRCVAAAALAKQWLGERLLEVHYEDLVLATEETLRQISQFLGVAYEPAMRTAHDAAQEIITASENQAGVHEKLFREPRPNDVGRWRRAAGDRGLRLASGVMASELRRNGYQEAPSASAALLLKGAARGDHYWRRRARPLLRRFVRKVAARPRAGR